MGTNETPDSGGQSGGGDANPYSNPYTTPSSPPEQGSRYPSYPDPSSGGSYSGYREGVHGEPVPESAWQYPDAATYQQPYPGYPPPYAGGPPPPAGYPGGYYPQYPMAQPTNGMAIASMVLGILWVGWLGSILALIFGYVARQQIRERGEGGDGMAIAGIVLGWIGVGFLLLYITVIAFAVGSSNY